MNSFMIKEEMENEFILALGVTEAMLEGVFKENIDNEIKELQNIKFDGPTDTEGMRVVIFRHTLNRLFYRSTKFALIFLENAFNYCLNRVPEERIDEIQELYNKYFELNTKSAIEIYNRTWDRMLETTSYKSIKMDITEMIRVEEAYNNREELKELLINMPHVSEEEYKDFLYGKADKSNKVYEYLTRMS